MWAPLCLVLGGCLFNGLKAPAPPPPLEGRGLGGGVGEPAPRGLKGCEGVRTALRRLLRWGVRLGFLVGAGAFLGVMRFLT